MIAVYIIAGITLVLVLMAVIPAKYVITADERQNFMFRVRYLFLGFVYEHRDGADKSYFRILFFKIDPLKKKEKKKKLAPAVQKKFAKKPEKISKKVSEKKSEKNPPPDAPEKKESFMAQLKNAYAVLTDAQLKTIIKPILSTLKELFRVFCPKQVDVTGVIGFSNPYHTGLFFGAYEVFAGVFSLRNSIRLDGDFNTDETIIQVNAKVRGSISFLNAALPVVRLVLNKPVRVFLKGVIFK